MRVFIELAYDGTNYHGWQRQPEAITVQHVLEKAFERLLRVPFPVMGCGRTDTGVHASHFVAHADWPGELPDESGRGFIWRLNGVLPADIAVSRIVPVSEKAHARFHAVSRSYVYKLHHVKNPFLFGRSTRIYGELDVAAMNEAARLLLFKGDFAAFFKAGGQTGTTICDVRTAVWRSAGTGELEFSITADRFLRSMVRAIVGTLLEVGHGRMSPKEFEAIIASADRSKAGKSAAACGLYLSQVVYPEGVW